MRIQKLTLLSLLICLPITAQNLKIKVLNSKDNLPLSNVSVDVNNKMQLTTNDEGTFDLAKEFQIDESTLTIKLLGFETQKITLKQINDQNQTIKLNEVIYQLESVSINNQKPNPLAIMEEVNKRLESNYVADGKWEKSRLFFKESYNFKAKQLEIDLKKSSGFSKKQVDVIENELKNYTDKLINKNSKSSQEILTDYYSNYKKDKTHSPKMDVIKAISINENGLDAESNEINKGLSDLLLKHLDSTKYYRIKSGWFGSRDTISLKKDFRKKHKKSNLAITKKTFSSFLENKNLSLANFDFISEPEKYNYTFKTKMEDENNNTVYVLDFKPKKSSADYTGTLHITENEFAITKCSYNLAEGENVMSANLKFLLGLKFKENVDTGLLTFKKDNETNKFRLQYVSQESGKYFYIDRPVKFIELAKTDRDVFSFDLKIEADNIIKTELLVVSRSNPQAITFDDQKEKDFDYLTIKKYDPSIWKNYISIEPNEAMRKINRG